MGGREQLWDCGEGVIEEVGGRAGDYAEVEDAERDAVKDRKSDQDVIELHGSLKYEGDTCAINPELIARTHCVR